MGNRGGFSWKRLLGISAAKSRVSRRIGVPLTRSGRQRKVGKALGCVIPLALSALFLATLACGSTGTLTPTAKSTAIPEPTRIPEPTATLTVEPTAIVEPTAAALPTARGLPNAKASSCDCASGNTLNCDDFEAWDAQACYLRCQEITGKDVHGLDGDKDGSACEWEY